MVLEGLGHYGGKGMVMFMVTEPYRHVEMDQEAKRVQEVRLGCKISRSALVAYFLRQGFSLPKLYHLFETECSNAGAYGKTFTFKLQVYNHHLNFLWNSDTIASMNSMF